MERELYHYGTKYHSGRFPYGSGDNPYQHDPRYFQARIAKFREDFTKEFGRKPTDKELASAFNMGVKEFQARRSLAKEEARAARRAEAIKLQKELGNQWSEIGRRMGIPESSVRTLLDPVVTAHQSELTSTMDVLKKAVADQKYIDVGKGVSSSMGISSDRLDKAVIGLRDQGYEIYTIYVRQLGAKGKQNTTMKVLALPGIEKKEVLANKADIGSVQDRFVDPHSSQTYSDQKKPIEFISSNKVAVVYGQEGVDKDGLIELRRGAEGLDLGGARYAQVRIGVDDTHYIKGMAVYSDTLPEGKDILVYSNKKEGTPLISSDPEAKQVLKPIKYDDPDNPFGAQIKQYGQRGYLNVVNEEGDWDTWSKNLASQMLSKQPTTLAKQQLNLAKEDRKIEFEQIRSLNNPVLREHMLMQFAEKCDTASVNLKAKALPNQSTHVLLPMSSVKATEIYAPNYEQGSKVVLIRYPHGGTFEIPELTVNNRNKEAEKIFKGGAPRDAVGIHHSVASQLSGADFDGDTVLVIPNNDARIVSQKPWKELRDFDPKAEYPNPEGAKRMSEDYKQQQMGVVSNLINDMTLRNAPKEDIIKAVRHSMVVIDAEKHNLDWRRSEKDHQIEELRRKYQAHDDGTYGGASTLISRASADARIPEVRRSYRPNKETGEWEYTPTGKTHVNKKGKEVPNISHIPEMKLTSDARTLMSGHGGTVMERIYADYANQMKQMANQARKEALSTEFRAYKPDMAKVYANEVQSIKEKVRECQQHAPIERKARLLAESKYSAIVRANPHMDDDHKKRVANRVLNEARKQVGSNRPKIYIEDREWEAIQKGAVTKTTQRELFKYADQEALKERALPKVSKSLTPAKLSMARARLKRGYTYDEVAQALGVSVSSLKNAMYSD